MEQQLRFKGYGDEQYGNSYKVFASLFHCWCVNHVSVLYLFLLAYAYRVVFQLMEKNL